jgi:hypothetical protein
MRVGASALIVTAFFVACGGNSQRRTNGGSGNTGAEPAFGGTGGDSISTTGGNGATGTGGTSASGGSNVGGSIGLGGSNIGATGGSSVGGKGGGTGGSGANGGTGAIGNAGEGAQGQAGGPDGSGGRGATGGTGGTGGTAGSAGTGGSGGGAGVPITSCTDAFPFLGTWDGNILDFFFEPLDELKLVLVVENDEIVGKLTWGGTGDPLPPVDGADVPWPPGYWDNAGPEPTGNAPEPWPGFAYTVVRGAGCDTTLRFSVSTAEIWQEWCALQTPVYTNDVGWGCTLQGGGSSDGKTCTVQPAGMTPETYPMWQCNACGAFGRPLSAVCQCNEAGCFASHEATHTFDLTYSVSAEAELLSGKDPSCGDCTVRLERQL